MYRPEGTIPCWRGSVRVLFGAAVSLAPPRGAHLVGTFISLSLSLSLSLSPFRSRCLNAAAALPGYRVRAVGPLIAACRVYRSNVGQEYGYRVYKDPSTFYSALGDFLADDSYERFQSDIAFGDNGDIEVKVHAQWLICVAHGVRWMLTI